MLVEVAIDYSHKTYFTKGVVKTNFWRLPWRDRCGNARTRVGATHLKGNTTFQISSRRHAMRLKSPGRPAGECLRPEICGYDGLLKQVRCPSE